jgi:hypothetical protein
MSHVNKKVDKNPYVGFHMLGMETEKCEISTFGRLKIIFTPHLKSFSLRHLPSANHHSFQFPASQVIISIRVGK